MDLIESSPNGKNIDDIYQQYLQELAELEEEFTRDLPKYQRCELHPSWRQEIIAKINNKKRQIRDLEPSISNRSQHNPKKDAIDKLFPYDEYRPGQKKMLEFIARKISNGDIGMIDAPTGSGKSLAVVGFLKVMRDAKTGPRKKLVIAVRTIKQQTIFLDELKKIKENHPDLKFSNILGKKHVCPYFDKALGDVDVYQLCQITKDEQKKNCKTGFSVKKGVINTCQCISEPHEYLDEVKKWASQVKDNMISLDKLKSNCPVCPYDVMIEVAKDADVILVTYNYVFNKKIRESLYGKIGLNSQDTYLLIDEAHNCGTIIEGINSIELTYSDVERIYGELDSLNAFLENDPDNNSSLKISYIKDIENCLKSLSKIIDKDIQKEHNDAKNRGKEWDFNTDFENILSVYKIKEILENEIQAPSLKELKRQTKGCCYKIQAIKIENSDSSEIGIRKFYQFLRLIERAKDYPNQFLPVYTRNLKNKTDIIEIKNIDPSPPIKDIIDAHGGCIMMSGTFAPIEGYKKYFFNSIKSTGLSLELHSIQNCFPKENRKVIGLSDVTSEYKQRDDKHIFQSYEKAIVSFIRMDGNLAIFFPSYDLLLKYQKTVESSCKTHGKQIFFESKNNETSNEDLIKFKGLPERGKSGVLAGVCGGKWSEGIDFPGKELVGAFIVGLPYAKWGNIRIEIIRLFGMRFDKEGKFIAYELPAINKAMQAIGRVIRTKEDKGILILGDSRYMSVELPPWIKQEMHPITSDKLDATLQLNKI